MNTMKTVEITQLERELGNLAASFRGAANPKEQHNLVRQYHEIMRQLDEQGWDAYLDVDAELPDEFMPESYMQRTGQSVNTGWKETLSTRQP